MRCPVKSIVSYDTISGLSDVKQATSIQCILEIFHVRYFQTLYKHEYMIKQCYGKVHKQAEQAVLGLDQRTVFSHKTPVKL